ncbi:unnamed protein product [Oppiella nova]|uniref:Sodefrin-like factor n=1 Tax=Oppiella nova TaxID=334625 RepID=A0A7R9LZ17_9ACAR|nr:unnamed protein product [Oppiella nova]CAG2168326.1 unnamed protein product [Oppiella nova]
MPTHTEGVSNGGHLEVVSAGNLSCYTCSTIDDIRCKVINETYYYSNYKYSTYNTRLYGSECGPGETYCAVQRLDAKINLSSVDYKFWAIQRKCVQHCQDGCFVLGERTKLSLCTTCCTTNYCNVGNTGTEPMIINTFNDLEYNEMSGIFLESRLAKSERFVVLLESRQTED